MQNGYIIPNGDTFGPEDNSFCYRVTHIGEGEKSGDFDGPLYRLELLYARDHEIKTADYIPPTYTFDDRNVPRSVMRGLGEGGFAFVNELRAKRQKAEGVGGRFQVKSTIAPDKPRGGLVGRILSFGKRK